MSYGESAAELITELARCNDTVPNYDDTGVRAVLNIFGGSVRNIASP